MLYKVGDYMHVNSGEKPSEYEIIEIAKYIIHKRYCENDVQSVMSQMDKDIIWQGSEGSGYAAGIEEVGDFLNEENIPNYNISDEEYNITQISSEIYLCSGRMWIETDESENIFFRFHQRVVLIFRWHDDSLKCCNVNISSTYRNIVDGREEIELPIKISYTDYIYLIKKVKEQEENIEKQQKEIEKQQKKIAEQSYLLQSLTYTDSLTGLNNRNKFDLLLNSDFSEKALVLGIAFFDLNGLKRVLGHSAGDDYLCHTAEEIKKVFEEKVYRIGGDEFIAMETEMSEEEFKSAVMLVKRGMQKNNINCAIGISWRDKNCNIAEQVKEADFNMYRDKRRFYDSKSIDK